MSSYIDAFEKGQEASRKAVIAKKEIKEILEELKKQLLTATEGKLEIFIKPQRESIQGNSLIDMIQNRNFRDYLAIVARNPKSDSNNIKELAEWNQENTGYPCKIEWGKEEYTCHDRKSLESCLTLLLQDPGVAEKLHQLIILPIPEKKDPKV